MCNRCKRNRGVLGRNGAEERLEKRLQRPATVENSPASSEKRLATLEKRQNKRFGRRNAALGSDSEGKEGVKRVEKN